MYVLDIANFKYMFTDQMQSFKTADEIWAPFQYPIRHRIVRSHAVTKLRYLYLG